MQIENQPRIQFHGIEIIHTSYSSNKRYNKDIEAPIDLDIHPKVFYPKDNPNTFSIIIEAFIEVKGYFTLKVISIGHFKLNGEITPEIKLTFINTNAPAIMFPYLRSFISTFTSNVGLSSGTLIIPPQFFSGELETIDNASGYEEE